MAKNEVKVDLPNRPKGDPVVLHGIGEVPNGSTIKVEDYQIATWEGISGGTWPENGLVLPAPPPEANTTGAQSEAEIQSAIRERQDSRSPEQVQKESDSLTAAIIKGDYPRPLMVDGEIVKGKTKDPVAAVSTDSKTK